MREPTGVEEAFKQLEEQSARIPQADNARAKNVHPQIREVLERDLPGHIETFLSGSYARKTQSVHLKDIDLICVLKDPDGTRCASADATMEGVREVARTCSIVKSTTKKVRAVKLFLHDMDFTVDVVPALVPEEDDGLLLPRRIPEEGYDDWTLEHPKGQLEAAVDKNRVCDGMYVRAVRVAKYWNKRPAIGEPLKSYHVEALVWHAIDGPYDLSSAFLDFLRKANDTLALGDLVSDPGCPGSYVNDRVSPEDAARAAEVVGSALLAAERAASEADLVTALKLWRDVLGPAFPIIHEDGGGSKSVLTAGSRIITPRSWGADEIPV